jgi:hypothetical protein
MEVFADLSKSRLSSVARIIADCSGQRMQCKGELPAVTTIHTCRKFAMQRKESEIELFVMHLR